MRSARIFSQRHEPRALELCLFVGLGVLAPKTLLAADYYVATTGSDSNPGTQAQPFATLQKGHDVAAAGDTIYIRGGTYYVTTPATSGAGISITKSGTSDTNRIKFWAYSGEVPVFDFSRMTISTTDYTSGFAVSGSWLHFKGLEICNVPMNTRSNSGMGVNNASNDIFELMNFHNNNGTGIFFSHGNGGHLVLNCDSHDNYDPTSSQGAGQNADGFGCHYQTAGASTIFRGCRAWWNSDDGYDLISQEVPVTFENSWAMSNGYINSGTAKPGSGNGNGFKAGSSKTGIRHLIRNCVAWKNAATGFYANHSSGGNTWYNNTSYSNGTQYDMLASTWDAAGNRTDGVILTGSLVHIMRNNISFPLDNTNMGGVDAAFNTWNLSITPSANDFASVTDTGCMGPRQADGSLPNLDFMKLRAGSQMIDKGTDVGLPYVGAAPDLGAYEYGAAGSGAAGTGGTPTTGGRASTGGTSATGGRLSTGGTATTGGNANAGGTISTGGAKLTGAVTSTGGAPTVGAGGATGGMFSTGGAMNNTGGRLSAGGAPVNTGGSLMVTGGRANFGGTNSTGGALMAMGGLSNGGGVSNIGGASSSTGATGTGGIANAAGASGTESATGGSSSSVDTGSCSCRTAGLPSRSSTLAGFGLLGLLALRSLRRERLAASAEPRSRS